MAAPSRSLPQCPISLSCSLPLVALLLLSLSCLLGYSHSLPPGRRFLEGTGPSPQPGPQPQPGGPPIPDACPQQPPLAPPLLVDPSSSSLAWNSSGALTAELTPPLVPLSGYLHLSLGFPQAEWTWQCSSLVPSPPSLPLHLVLLAPGQLANTASLIDITASNVFFTVSGGSFLTDVNGNFSFTPQSASLLLGNVSGRFFSTTSNVQLSNVQFPLPNSQIPAVSGRVVAKAASFAVEFLAVTSIPFSQVLAAASASAGELAVVGDSAVQFVLRGNATAAPKP